MKKLIIRFTFLVFPMFIYAHNPLTAMYRFIANENGGVVNIVLTQDGVNNAFIAQYGLEALNEMSQDRFKELMVAYVKSNFKLEINGESISLLEGGIKLGKHQTNLKFITKVIPKDAHTLSINIPAFKENENHQTVFSFQIGNEKNKLILDKRNNYKETLNFNESEAYINWTYCLIAFFIIIALGFFFKKKFQNKNRFNKLQKL